MKEKIGDNSEACIRLLKGDEMMIFEFEILISVTHNVLLEVLLKSGSGESFNRCVSLMALVSN